MIRPPGFKNGGAVPIIRNDTAVDCRPGPARRGRTSSRNVHGFVFSCQRYRVGERTGESAGEQPRSDKVLIRLSSGLRINSSGVAAAGLAVANAHRSQTAIPS